MPEQQICDEPDCDHTPESRQCKAQHLPHNSCTPHRRVSTRLNFKGNQSSRISSPRNLHGTSTGGAARSILSNVIQKASVFPSTNTPRDKRTAVRRKRGSFCSSLYKRVASLVSAWCCLPVSNFLGKWRFTRDFEWRSTTKYDNRLLVIGNKVT